MLFTKRKVRPLHQDQGVHLRPPRKQPEPHRDAVLHEEGKPQRLVEAYNLELYPTLLIVGPNGLELERVVGGAAIRDCIEQKLVEIYRENNA